MSCSAFSLYIFLLATFLPLIRTNAASGNDGLANIKITNRAQCAIDSKLPSESFFLILDGYNAGKLAYQVGRNLGVSAESESLEAMKDFRLISSELFSAIIDRMAQGRLPLLPADISRADDKTLPQFYSVLKTCSDKIFCIALNRYIEKIWHASTLPSEIRARELIKIDNFTEKSFLKAQKKLQVSCHYVKRFSPLQSHLHTSAVNELVLEEIASAWLNKEKFLTPCQDADPSLDSRNSVLQFDLIGTNQDEWSRRGFDFWNSVKIYFSWAWRNTNFASQISPRYGSLFKSLAIEDSLMMVPNGCKSIVKSECDAETLSVNNIREMLKDSDSDIPELKELPEGPEENILSRGLRGVNNDFLGTRKFSTASEWVGHFRKNYIPVRGHIKNRFDRGVRFLNLVQSSVEIEHLVKKLKLEVANSTQDTLQRNEVYYLCTEIRLSGDRRLDFMRSQIDQLADYSFVKKSLHGGRYSMRDYLLYYNQMVSEVIPICEQLENRKFWGGDFEINKAGFRPWAKQILMIPLQMEESQAGEPSIYGQPFFVWKSAMGKEKGNVLCYSAIECAREVIQSFVDVLAVSKYADAYLPTNGLIASPHIFNPFSELVACGIYDPSFVTKKNDEKLVADLISASLFGWNYLPVYLELDRSAPRVSSFNQLLKEGKLRFQPNVEKSKIEATLVADFGQLLGAPCSISISNAKKVPIDFYAFQGVTVNYCQSKQENELRSEGPNKSTLVSGGTLAVCGSCSLNFIGISRSVGVTSGPFGLNPFKLGITLFRAIQKWINGNQDTVNIPKSYEINFKRVGEALLDNNSIPVTCVDQLAQGLGCYANMCEARAVDFFERYTHGKVKSIETNSSDSGLVSQAWIESNVCDGKIIMSFSCDSNSSYFRSVQRHGGLTGVSQDCKNFLDMSI